MLVLTRKRGEGIILPDQGITIRVIGRSSGGQIRIGVDADQSIRIFREEIYHGASSGGSSGHYGRGTGGKGRRGVNSSVVHRDDDI